MYKRHTQSVRGSKIMRSISGALRGSLKDQGWSRTQINLDPKFFLETEFILDPKIYLGQKNFYIFSLQFFSTKICFGPKFFFDQKYLYQEFVLI